MSQRLLNRVADIIANGGDGSSRNGDDGTRNNEGPSIVDQQLLDRVARIISQNEGQLSWAHKTKTRSNNNDLSAQPTSNLVPPRNSNEQEYGVPPREVPETVKELAGSPFELSPPEAVPRIASFDLTDDYDNIGYSASTQQQVVQDTYSDNSNRFQGNGKIELEQPRNAERIASFDIEGETPPAPFTPPQARGGYYTNNH